MQPENPYAAPRTDVSFQGNVGFVKPTLKQLLFSFEGRVPRRIYWLVSLLAGLVVGIGSGVTQASELIGSILILIGGIFMIWTGLAVGVKRWHDRGKSGWWILIGFIPIIGGIWQFIECGCLRGTVGPNTYGADPTDQKML